SAVEAVAGCWLAAGYWLVAGCWLAAGRWLLAAGRWRLAACQLPTETDSGVLIRAVLQSELDRRRAANRCYSLRAFAQADARYASARSLDCAFLRTPVGLAAR